MLRSLSRAIRPLRHLRLEKCCNSNQKSTFRSGTNVGNCVRAFTSQPDPQLANATRGIKEGITLYNTENFTASEGVFRTVLQHLTNDSTGHSRTEKIFEVAAKLNLANSLREQYKVSCSPHQRAGDSVETIGLLSCCHMRLQHACIEYSWTQNLSYSLKRTPCMKQL